jgi:hypothetical protein
MPYEQHQEKQYANDQETIFRAALASVESLNGGLVSSSAEKGRLEVKFPKKLLGKTLGERTHLTAEVRTQGEGSLVVVDAYPLDAIEQKLMFGARKGVTQTVVKLFIEHLDEQLG